MSPRVVTSLLFAVFVAIACSVQTATALKGELRMYTKTDFKQLRHKINIPESNQCYTMPCADLDEIKNSAKWTGLPVTGDALPDGLAKIAFYSQRNCTGERLMLNTRRGQVRKFGWLGMDEAVRSFVVLEKAGKFRPTTKFC